MKRKILVILITFINIFAFCGNVYLISKPKQVEVNNCKLKNNMFSMMLETDANSKTYVQSLDNNWPTNGYVFNEEMSKCENGSKLHWDNNKVIMEGNISDNCYVFFDKYSPVTITNYNIEADSTSVRISITAKAGTGSISNYFYSKDDGATFVKSTSNIYVFDNLALGTYKIKAYVEDSNGKISNIIDKTVDVTAQTLASWIKNSYTGIQGENYLYYHDKSLANGAGDNSYRYAGQRTYVNNFICFKNSSKCTADELFRIIGVIDNKVKVIKYQSIGNMAWDSNGSNVWSTSSLNSYLNTTYYNSLSSLLKKKISDTTWIVGGNTDISRDSVSTAYKNELLNPATTLTFTTKIGLMYASDYGFAASPAAWTGNMSSYDGSSIENWLVILLDQWIITRVSSSNNLAYLIYDDGTLANGNTVNGGEVRPCFYLLPSVTYKSGTGSESDPFLIN